MHPLFEKASGLTEAIIAAAIEVHRERGQDCWSPFTSGA